MMIRELFFYKTLSIGDTWAWTITLNQYPSGAGWVLSYTFKAPGTDSKTVVSTANADGISHNVKVTATENASFNPGEYKVYVYITSSDGERQTLGSVDVKILPDLTKASADYDPRSYNELCLDALEKCLQGAVTRDYLETVFKDSTFKYKSTFELVKLRNYFRQEIDRENGIRPGRVLFKKVF